MAGIFGPDTASQPPPEPIEATLVQQQTSPPGSVPVPQPQAQTYVRGVTMQDFEPQGIAFEKLTGVKREKG